LFSREAIASVSQSFEVTPRQATSNASLEKEKSNGIFEPGRFDR
jgi:hypothetical protein